jgi:hypothetical protein
MNGGRAVYKDMGATQIFFENAASERELAVTEGMVGDASIER